MFPFRVFFTEAPKHFKQTNKNDITFPLYCVSKHFNRKPLQYKFGTQNAKIYTQIVMFSIMQQCIYGEH